MPRAKKPAARARAAKPAAPDPAVARELAATRKQLERATARIAEFEAEPKPAPPPAEVAALAAEKVPADHLEAQHVAHRMALELLSEAARMPDVTFAERSKEFRLLAAAAHKLMPDSRRWEAEQRIIARQHRLEQRARDRGAVKPVPKPPRA